MEENKKQQLNQELDSMLSLIDKIVAKESEYSSKEDEEHRMAFKSEDPQEKLDHTFKKLHLRLDNAAELGGPYHELAQHFNKASDIAMGMEDIIKDGFLNIVETMTTGIHFDKIKEKIDALKKDLSL